MVLLSLTPIYGPLNIVSRKTPRSNETLKELYLDNQALTTIFNMKY